MTTLPPINLRVGALALATSALLFAVFPLVRPFFRMDAFSPALAAVASGPLASPPWVIAHLLLAVAFVLLPIGLLALYWPWPGASGEVWVRLSCRRPLSQLLGLG